MTLPKDKAQIGLVLVGIVAVGFGLGRTLSDSNHVRPEMMMHQGKGGFLEVIPKEAGPWLIVGGAVALGIGFLLQRK